MVAFHLHRTLKESSDSSEAIDVGRLSDALESAVSELKNQQSHAAATQKMKEKLVESPLPDLSGQNKRQGDGGDTEDPIET